MKRIINGKRYDTETATEVGTHRPDIARGALDYYEEHLYRKRGGEFFLYGSGNVRSKYARAASGGWCAGERIYPMTYAEAQAWAEAHLDGDAYEAVFGEVNDDGERTVLAMSLSTAQLEQIKRLAAQDGAPSVSAWVLGKLGV